MVSALTWVAMLTYTIIICMIFLDYANDLHVISISTHFIWRNTLLDKDLILSRMQIVP